MDDLKPAIVSPPLKLTATKHWQARLELGFARRDARSYLAHRLHHGPLVVQKSLHPEGEDICHAVVVHPPGGVAGGDALHLQVQVGEGARALLTTPGAGKWYKANGTKATQTLTFQLAAGSGLEWLPQENILFDAAEVGFSAEIALAADATLAAWDIVCLGRQAQQEIWQTGFYQLNQRITRNGRLIWNERARMQADDLVKTSRVGLGGAAVFGTFLVCAGAVPAELLQACREIVLSNANVGITALPDVLCIRYIGNASQQARQYFEHCWQILRPWYYQKDAIRPRIWNT
ncbi:MULTISPECIES: urease accessory protein UreD [unclassified Methylophilus]|uniref:urease accessory protein UreD n=1 Tax=unclassified Methylophilus TaxID=2630143 RepID=UPI0006F5B760|nr:MULTISPECIES: urease accessory protein UreD [unclassified Methylophilus]KQT43777.1 urease accessory protein ureD [Methylophilus sp. Leaf416]KQT59262.1 urease accessory protein ureD [Methylophilus sp. Leaf459]